MLINSSSVSGSLKVITGLLLSITSVAIFNESLAIVSGISATIATATSLIICFNPSLAPFVASVLIQVLPVSLAAASTISFAAEYEIFLVNATPVVFTALPATPNSPYVVAISPINFKDSGMPSASLVFHPLSIC